MKMELWRMVMVLCGLMLYYENIYGGIPPPQPSVLRIEGYHEKMNWPNFNGSGITHFGQVSGVAVNSKNDVYVFHRSDRVWDAYSFDYYNVLKESKFISAPTIYKFDSKGTFMSKWGSDLFLMPHGISVDQNDDLWVTDVGRHQIFKISTKNDKYSVELTLGTFKVPGSNQSHFCKPTDVAVSTSYHSFYVADGYCNSRIIQFDMQGKFIRQFGSYSDSGVTAPLGQFWIPHSLAIDQQLSRLYIADRENARVQVFGLESQMFEQMYNSNSWGHRLFAVGINQNDTSHVAVVNGPPWNRVGPEYKGVRVWRVAVDDGDIGEAIGTHLVDPHDIDVDSYGHMYVADLKGRVVKYVKV